MKRSIRIKVSGKVQGVYYRKGALEKARECGVFGFVQNTADRSVYIEAEGDVEPLANFLIWCYQGPKRAKVKVLRKEFQDLMNFESFEIKDDQPK